MNDEAYREATGGFIASEKYKTATANGALAARADRSGFGKAPQYPDRDRRNELMYR
jgi:hypothetical protein